jgi:hypothetical protein
MLRSILISVLACSSILANSQGVMPGEQEWLDTIATVAGKKAEPSFRVKVMVFTEPASDISVLSAVYKEGVCTLYLSARENAVDTLVQNFGKTREIARLAIAAHEYGHCVHRAAKLRGISLRTANRWPEALADAYALAWTHTFYPEYYEDVVKFFWTLRKKDSAGKHAAGLKVVANANSGTLQGTLQEKAIYLLNNIDE